MLTKVTGCSSRTGTSASPPCRAQQATISMSAQRWPSLTTIMEIGQLNRICSGGCEAANTSA
eukprot:scaffold48671_cov71-Phaeocystis_antarctica.AAC.8